MKKTSAFVCISGSLAVISLSAPPIAAPAPGTIPAVQSWTTGTGTMGFTASSRIVVNTSDAAALSGDASSFAQDLNGLLGRPVAVVTGASANAGDVFLRLGATDAAIGDEGYIMTIASDVDISARTAAGVFYGTRTLLQMLRQGASINRGTIKDYPRGRWRGQMVDVGRKYFTVSWLETLIRDLAYVKMNLLHLHLSDGISATNNGGFRLQSAKHPEITSSQYYSTAQLRSLIHLAAQYHVTILPEIDLPGHVNWLYEKHRNLLLNRQVLGTQYWALDLSLDTAYSFIKDILEEFLPQFPGPFWHLGADEYMFINEFASFPQLTTWAKNRYGNNAHANDCYRHFTNWADSIVKAHGKTMWTWNDVLLGITGTKTGACTLAADIYMDHWGTLDWIGWGGVFPSAERALGYRMMNCSWDIYYVIGKNLGIGDPRWVYDNWELHTFAGGNLTSGDSNILGGKFPVWSDIPAAETEAQVWQNTFMLNRAVAQKIWGGPKPHPGYSGFQSMAAAIGRAPAPVVSVKEPFVRHRLVRDGIESARIFDQRGVLLKSISGKAFEAARVSPNVLQATGACGGLTAGSYLCRLRGKEFERTEKILLVK